MTSPPRPPREAPGETIAPVAIESPRSPAWWRLAPAPFTVHVVTLVAAFAVLFYLGRNLWFFGDEWDFIAARRQGSGGAGIWAPHNEHWSTIPILVFRSLYDGFGLHSYRPYFAVLLGLHVVLAHLLWRLMLRIGTEAWLATAFATMFLLLGGGFEDLLWAFQMGFIASLVFGLVGVLLIDHHGRFGARDFAAWLFLIAGLMCSGVGVSMVVTAGIGALLRRGWRAALLVVSAPAITYAAWFVRYGHTNANTIPASRSQLLMLPTYVWTGLTRSLESISGMTGAGAVLVLGLVVLLLRCRPVARHGAAAAYAAALGAVVFFIITGVGRIALGIDQAASSRYVYIACVLLLAGIGLVLTELGRGSAAISGVILVGIVAATVQGVGVLVVQARSRVALVTPFRGQVLASVRLIQSGAPILADPDAEPEPRYDPDLTLERLRRLVADGAFGTVPDQPPESQLAAALQLQVVVGGTPAVSGGTAPRLSSTPAGSRRGTGCIRLHDAGPVNLRLLFTGPASVTLTPSSSGDLAVAMATTVNPSLVTTPRAFPLTAGRTAVLSVVAADAAPVLSLPPGDDLVCGVQL